MILNQSLFDDIIRLVSGRQSTKSLTSTATSGVKDVTTKSNSAVIFIVATPFVQTELLGLTVEA